MANLTSKLFGLHNTSTVDGDDSRTQGDENLNALAGSMETSFPNLDDTACTKTGAQLNDTTEAGSTETVTGAWTFSTNFVSLTRLSTALYLAGSGDQEIRKAFPGDMVLSTDNAGSIVSIRVNDTESIAASSTSVSVKVPMNAQDDVTVTGNASATGTITGQDIVATGNVTGTDVTATGALAGATVTGSSYVSAATLRVGNSTDEAGVGSVPDAAHTAIEVFDEAGSSLGYVYAFATAS